MVLLCVTYSVKQNLLHSFSNYLFNTNDFSNFGSVYFLPDEEIFMNSMRASRCRLCLESGMDWDNAASAASRYMCCRVALLRLWDLNTQRSVHSRSPIAGHAARRRSDLQYPRLASSSCNSWQLCNTPSSQRIWENHFAWLAAIQPAISLRPCLNVNQFGLTQGFVTGWDD